MGLNDFFYYLDNLKDNSKTFKKDSKTAHDKSFKEIEDEFKKVVIDPIKDLCEPLILSQSVYDIDSLYTLEVGLSEALIGDLDENMREMAQGGGSKPQENPPATRNKARNEVGPDKRMTGLPAEAGNQNVDTRTERRVG